MQRDRGGVRVHGPALRFVREARQKTITELAEQAGISRALLSMVEAGHRKTVRPEVFRILVADLGVHPDVLRALSEAPASSAA